MTIPYNRSKIVGKIDPIVVAATFDLELTYQSNGDTNGLIYYLGTNKLSQTFSNPVESGAVVVTESSFINTSTKGKFAFDRNINNVFYSANQPGNYLKLNIGDARKLKVKGYSMRAIGGTDNALRNWKLQGSDDDANWTDIDSQSNAASFSNNAWFYKEITGQTTRFKFFRILSNGQDANGNNFLVLNELELYGTLTE